MSSYLEVLKKYAVFSGRARRTEYWMFLLISEIIVLVLGTGEMLSGGPGIMAHIYNLAVLIPTIAVGVRRMHDTDHSGWWLLFPIVNIVFACTEGTRGDNRFGANPKASGSADLLIAARDGHAETVKRLLKSGANINTVQADGLTSLHIAAINDRVEVAKLLLNAGAQVDATDKIGNTPLHAAAFNGTLAVAAVLIQGGANVNAVSGKHRTTPLHLAATKGFSDMVVLLLKSGANARAVLADGSLTPRTFAMHNGYTGIVELLKAAEDKLDAEASTSTETKEHLQPAARSKHYEVYGLDLSPDAARTLTFEQAAKQVAGLKMSPSGAACLNDDYSVLLHFRKTGGLFAAEISADTTSGFLGMGRPQPEQVWTQLGYRLQEDLGQKVTWTNGDAKIEAHCGSGGLNEIYYLVPEKAVDLDAEAAGWRELGYFGGGEGCIRNAMMVSGMCYAEEDAVDGMIRYVKEDWKGCLPQGFWLVKAEAYDKSTGSPYCLGHDGQFEIQWLEILADMEKEGRLLPCASRPFRVPSHDFIGQTLIDIVHIKGLLSRD